MRFGADTSLDVAAARLVARLRLVVLTAVAIGVPMAAGEEAHGGFQFLVALAAVPAAGVLAGSVERLRAPAASLIGVLIDLGVLLAAARTFTTGSTAILVMVLSAVLLAAYTGGRLVGVLAGGLGVGTALAGGRGSESEVESAVLLLFVAGMGVALVVVERSVGERGRADVRTAHYASRAEAVLQRVAEAVVVTDASGAVVTHNPAAGRFVGLPARCGEGLRLRADGKPVVCDNGCGLAASAPRGGGPVDLDLTCVATDDTEVPVLVSVTPVVGADGAVHEYVHSLRDITRLKQADDAKNIFLATATHELKTPLTVISGFLETIDRPEMDDDARRDAVAIMRRRAKELSAIIERILLASRIESGRVKLTLGRVDAAAVATERVNDLGASTRRDVTVDARTDLPYAWADAGAIAIVLDHLIDNALKYSAGSVIVLVHADESHVVVEVTDEGIGMDAEQVEHCFEKFWQADGGDARRTSGTGIGLYIVASLVEAMHGTVAVTSAPDEGATFAIRLPRADRLALAPPGAQSPADEPTLLPTEPSIVREFMRQIGIPSPRPRL